MQNLKDRYRAAEKQVRTLKEKIKQAIEAEGDTVEKNLSSDLLNILNTNTEQINRAYPEGSFPNLFWKEQLKAGAWKSRTWTRTRTRTPDMDTDMDADLQSKNDLQLILLTTITCQMDLVYTLD